MFYDLVLLSLNWINSPSASQTQREECPLAVFNPFPNQPPHFQPSPNEPIPNTPHMPSIYLVSSCAPSENLFELLSDSMDRMIHQAIQKILAEFSQPVFESGEIYQQIYKALQIKAASLLSSLFDSSLSDWNSQLFIRDPSPEQEGHFNGLVSLLESLKKGFSEKDLEDFSRALLRTPELATNTGRLVLHLTIPFRKK